MAHFNFRLFLRPTLVGRIIIDRLTAEGADRQAEARRWIELGYMCEQAGFRLDGNTLFQAGRPAGTETSATAQLAVHSVPVSVATAPEASLPVAQPSTSQPAPSVSAALAPSPRPVAIETPLPSAVAAAAFEPSTAGAPVATTPAPANQLDSQLLGNLRNLAH